MGFGGLVRSVCLEIETINQWASLFPSVHSHEGITHHLINNHDIGVIKNLVAAVTSVFQHTRAEMCVCHRQYFW